MSNEIIRAMSVAHNRVRQVLVARRQALFDLVSSRDVPDRFAAELASVVGFTNDLRLSTRITDPAEWRRVIELAPQIWQNKGAHEAYRDMVRAFAGARSWIGDWFSFRTVVGSTVLPWFSTQSATLNGHYWTELHVEDLNDDLDQDLVADAVDLVRPIGERVNITFTLFIENWDNLFRWAVTGDATVDSHALTLDATSAAASVESDTDESLWDHVTYNALVYVATGGTLSFSFRDDGGGGVYRLDMDQGVAAANIELFRDGGSVATGTTPLPGPPAASTGSITTVAVASLVDTETFTLDDGLNTAVVFEFDVAGDGVSGSNTAVDVSALTTADEVRDAIIAAVNGVSDYLLRITASDGGAATVDLTHDQNTHLGNTPITETVAAAGFVVAGFTGGVDESGQLVSVRTEPLVSGTSLEITIAINGATVITYVDGSPRAAGGTVTWGAAADLHTVLWFEVLPANADTATLNA